MREILFRGKRISDGKWCFGYVVPAIRDCYDKTIEIIDEEGISYDELDYYNPMFGGDFVDPETVGQFIGITDQNGIKIFEGDILESAPKKKARTRVLYVINDIRKCTNAELWVRGMKFEVIGNIHDNPEFMEAYEESFHSAGLVTLEE